MEKKTTLLPDFGKHLAAKGTPQKTLLIYTSWEMDTLSVVGLGRYCTTRVQPQDGNLYCATFDFGDDVLRGILKAATNETQNFIAEKLLEDPASIRNMVLPTPISVGIGAVLGDLQQGLHDLFIPLIITEVFGFERESEYIYGKTRAQDGAETESAQVATPPITSGRGTTRNKLSLNELEVQRAFEIALSVLVAIFLIVAAEGRHAYGFYILLRLAATVGGAYWAVRVYQVGPKGWLWVFAAVALLLNPFLPIRMQRTQWQPIDLWLGVLLLGWSGYWAYRKPHSHRGVDSER